MPDWNGVTTSRGAGEHVWRRHAPGASFPRILAPPPGVNQLDPFQDPSPLAEEYDCGEATVTSLLALFGVHTTDFEVRREIFGVGADGTVREGLGTRNVQLAAALEFHMGNGFAAALLDRGPALEIVPGLLAGGHRVLCLLWQNADCECDGSRVFVHWMLCFGFDAGEFVVMNPNGGVYERIDGRLFELCCSGQYVIVNAIHEPDVRPGILLDGSTAI